MKRNGSIIAHGREWPLYEWQSGEVTVLRMSPQDKLVKERLDEKAIQEYRKHHNDN